MPPTNRGCLLIVDDETELKDALCETLHDEGYETVGAEGRRLARIVATATVRFAAVRPNDAGHGWHRTPCQSPRDRPEPGRDHHDGRRDHLQCGRSDEGWGVRLHSETIRITDGDSSPRPRTGVSPTADGKRTVAVGCRTANCHSSIQPTQFSGDLLPLGFLHFPDYATFHHGDESKAPR